MAGNAAMRMIVIGARGTGRELLRRLGTRWEITLVDEDRARLEQAAAIRDLDAVVGDGSSVVVLRKAGLDDAAALVAATHDDDTNLEAIRLAKESGLLRIVGVAADADRVEDYRKLEVAVFSPHGLAARNIELALEPRKVASSAFAGGKAEAIEVHIAPDASVAGKRLRDLHSHTWVVAAVLRGDRLIVPHGETRIEVGDRITVVGAASDYSAIVTTFTSGVSTFPLGFGRSVALAVESEADVDGVAREAVRLIRASRAEVLTVALPGSHDSAETRRGKHLEEAVMSIADGVDVEFRPTAGSVTDRLLEAMVEENVGIAVVAGTEPDARFRRFKMARLLTMYLSARRVPILLARSPGPYEEVLVPARRTEAGEAAARAAIDLATGSGASLVGVNAVAPPFVATRTDTAEEARLAMAWLREEAAVHGLTVRRKVRQGNPVRVIAGLVSNRSLLVLGAPEPPVRALGTGISGLIAARVPCSVLLVPTRR